MGNRDGHQKIEFRLIPWSEKVFSHIRRAPKTDPTISIDYFRREVMEGKARVFGIFADDRHVASLTASVMKGDLSDEFVVHVIGSEDAKANIFDALPAMEVFARRYGCSSIRFQTCRAGFMKKAQEKGYQVTDYVMRKDVAA